MGEDWKTRRHYGEPLSDVLRPREIRFEYDGQPLPKQRPRVGKHGTFTPEKTRVYEGEIAWHARLAMGPRPALVGDLAVTIEFMRKGKQRADLDNLTKAVLDGLNGVAYMDDSQITALRVSVRYGAVKGCARVTVCEA